MVTRRALIGTLSAIVGAGCAGRHRQVTVEKIQIENWLEKPVIVAVTIARADENRDSGQFTPLFSAVVDVPPQENNRVGTTMLRPNVNGKRNVQIFADSSINENAEPEGYLHTGEDSNGCFSIAIGGVGTDDQQITQSIIARDCDKL
jgi:hypothetical protein